MRTSQGILDLKKWECGVPGKDKTLWEGGLFKLDLIFPDGDLNKILARHTVLTMIEQNILRSRPNVRPNIDAPLCTL